MGFIFISITFLLVLSIASIALLARTLNKLTEVSDEVIILQSLLRHGPPNPTPQAKDEVWVDYASQLIKRRTEESR